MSLFPLLAYLSPIQVRAMRQLKLTQTAYVGACARRVTPAVVTHPNVWKM